MRQFLLLMLSISFSCSLHSFNYRDYPLFENRPKNTIVYRFRYEQTCTLARFGVSSFLESVKCCPDFYENILWDIKEFASFNKTRMPHTFHEIIRTLDKRIARIENLQGKTIDHSTLALGVGQIAVSTAIIYAMYYTYQHFFLKDKEEFDRLHNSVVFESMHKKLRLKCQLQMYADSFAISLFITIVGISSGISNICNGFNPHYDDAYLETYKSLLAQTYRERYKDTRRKMKPSE